MPDEQGNNRDEFGRFLPGTSGNPKGRPRKGESITDALREFAERKNADGMLAKEALAERLFKLALIDGDVAAVRYIYDRLDGTPRQTIENTGEMTYKVRLPDEQDIDSDA